MIEIILPEYGIRITIHINTLPPTPPASAALSFQEAQYEQRKTA